MWFLAVCACPLVSGRGSPASLRVPHRLATSALAHNARLVHATIRYGVDRHRCAVTSPEAKVLACTARIWRFRFELKAAGVFALDTRGGCRSHPFRRDPDVIITVSDGVNATNEPSTSWRDNHSDGRFRQIIPQSRWLQCTPARGVSHTTHPSHVAGSKARVWTCTLHGAKWACEWATPTVVTPPCRTLGALRHAMVDEALSNRRAPAGARRRCPCRP